MGLQSRFRFKRLFFCQFIFKHCLQWKQVESPKPTDPSKERNILNLCSSVTAVALRKNVYTCFPGLVYNECQVTLPFLQIYPSMSVPNNSYCKRLLLSRWWDVWITIRFGTKTCHDRTFFLLKKTIIIIPCTVHFGIIMRYQPGPIKLSFLA